jgi:hypothetical protein
MLIVKGVFFGIALLIIGSVAYMLLAQIKSQWCHALPYVRRVEILFYSRFDTLSGVLAGDGPFC